MGQPWDNIPRTFARIDVHGANRPPTCEHSQLRELAASWDKEAIPVDLQYARSRKHRLKAGRKNAAMCPWAASFPPLSRLDNKQEDNSIKQICYGDKRFP